MDDRILKGPSGESGGEIKGPAGILITGINPLNGYEFQYVYWFPEEIDSKIKELNRIIDKYGFELKIHEKVKK